MQTSSFLRASLGLTFSFLAFSSCSLMTPQHNSRSTGPEVRDLGYQPPRAAADLAPRKRVIVLPFIDATNRSGKAAEVARDAFIKSLRKTDEYVIVANSDFPKDVATYLKNGEYDLEAMAKTGGAMGLAGILEGKVVAIKAKRIGDEVGLVREVRAHLTATVQVRMVNTKNGTVSLNETKTADVEDSTTRVGERSYTDRTLEDDPKLIESVVTEAFRSFVPKITQATDKLSWEGRVAMVKGDRIYLNAGRISGLQIGDILKITEEGEDVYDPDTGALIGRVPGRLKGTVEVVSYFGKDGSISIIHSGSGFRENDHVELY